MQSGVDLRITYVRFEGGERYPIMCGASGIPEWYPTLFSTSRYRNASKAPQTAWAALGAIRSLLWWAQRESIDLEARFRRRNFLTPIELESLAVSLSYPTTDLAHECAKLGRTRASGLENARARAPKRGVKLNNQYVYSRLSYVAEYLKWIATHLVEREARCVDKMTADRISAMSEFLSERRPLVRRRSGASAKQAQSPGEEAALLNLARAEHPDNPFTALTAGRNSVIIMMLNELGLRAGELLAIKVTDIDFHAQEIVIERRHHDDEDPRQYQPVVKTLDRRLPLSDELTSRLHHYVLSGRRQFPRARQHPMLFVSTRGSRSGRAGEPMSRQTLATVTSALSEKLPRGSQHVHPHRLRHNAASRFYRQLREQEIPEDRIERLLEAKFGWAEGSGTARAYIESEIQAQSLKAQRAAQEIWTTKSNAF